MSIALDLLRTCLAAAEPGEYEDINYSDGVAAFRYLHAHLPKQASTRKVQVAPGRYAHVFKINCDEDSDVPTDVILVELDGFSTQVEFGTAPSGKPYLYFYGVAMTPHHGHRYRDEDDSPCPRQYRDILTVILSKAVKMTDGYLKESGATAASEPSTSYNPGEALREAIYRRGGSYTVKAENKTFRFAMPYGIAVRMLHVGVKDEREHGITYTVSWKSPDQAQDAPVVRPLGNSYDTATWRRFSQDLYRASSDNVSYVRNLVLLLARAYDTQVRHKVESAAEPAERVDIPSLMRDTKARLAIGDIVATDGQASITFREHTHANTFEATVLRKGKERRLFIRTKSEYPRMYLQVLGGATEYFEIKTKFSSFRSWFAFVVASVAKSGVAGLDMKKVRIQ